MRKIKSIIKKLILKKDEKVFMEEKPVSFFGGITPINEAKMDDVFIVGFPKSGNTLMQHTIAHLYYGFNEACSRSMINLVTPDIYTSTHYFRFNDICFFKSHERPQKEYKKVIYIMRDGREALLSYYHMMRNMGKSIKIEDLYEGNIEIYGGQWSEHIEQWEKNPYNADILFLKFEDLLNNKKAVLVKICEFLNIQKSENELNNVIKYTGLVHMKELEKRTDWKKMKRGRILKGNKFIRKGEAKSFLKEVPNDLIKTFEAQNITMLKKHYCE